MRKLTIILAIVFMLTGIAYADEEFTFHKGLRFGMTSEEAIQFEKDTNGVDFSRKAYFELGDTISAKTTFANEDADMFLSFDDNKLSAAVFYNRMVFDTDGYYKNIEVFNSKYGEPISSSDSSFMKMPAKGYDAVELYGSSGLYYYNQKLKIYNMSVVDLSEYRVETTEGYYDIETILCSYTYSGYRCYSIITSYAYIDKDDYLNSQINETQQQQAEDQNRNDDL